MGLAQHRCPLMSLVHPRASGADPPKWLGADQKDHRLPLPLSTCLSLPTGPWPANFLRLPPASDPVVSAQERDQRLFLFHGVAPSTHRRACARMASRTIADGRSHSLTEFGADSRVASDPTRNGGLWPSQNRSMSDLVHIHLEEDENHHAGDRNVQPNRERKACDSAVHREPAGQREKERRQHHGQRDDGKDHVAG